MGKLMYPKKRSSKMFGSKRQKKVQINVESSKKFRIWACSGVTRGLPPGADLNFAALSIFLAANPIIFDNLFFWKPKFFSHVPFFFPPKNFPHPKKF